MIYHLTCLLALVISTQASAIPDNSFTVNLQRRIHHGPSRHKLGSSSTIDLTSVGEIAYTGPLFIGTPLQGTNSSSFLYDSGSSYLMVTNTNCTNCSSQYYDPANSQTIDTNTGYSISQMAYGVQRF